MEARLVQLDRGRQGGVIPVDRPELVLGRDPSADVVLPFDSVSRRHALIRALGDRHTLADLGSSNGTSVNGIAVGEAVLLQPGDRIDLGGEVTLVYELGEEEYEDESTGFPIAALLGLTLLLAAAAGGAWWYFSQPQSLDPEAVALAAQGLEASRAGDPGTAKERLQEAAGILYRQGHLDDVARADVMRIGMERLGAALPGAVDLWSAFQRALEDSRPRPPPEPERAQRVGCRLDEVGARDLEVCLRERIELVMLALWQDPTEIPDTFHREVGERLQRENGFLRKSLERGRPLVPKLRRAFEEEKMPPLLHYLALIESGYNPDALSPAKALGLWQFMPATGKQYGLRIGGPGDERRDIEKSTRAAVQYLKGLAFEFGGDALLLALAGYNRGENGVRRALKRLDNPFVDRNYWRLVEEDLLPEETAKYVPRFMAAAVAGEAGLPGPSLLSQAGY